MPKPKAQQKLTISEYLRSILAIIAFYILLLISSILIPIIAIITFGKANNWIVKRFAPLLGKPVLFILGINFKINDLRADKSSPVIFLFNHCSTLDIPVFLALALERIRIVIKWELQYIPFFFIICRLTGQIFIKRQNSAKAIATLDKSLKRIKRQNLSLVIAPEGSRKHEGIIGPFKKGAFHLAIKLGYPIVPIYFDGNARLSYAGSLMSKKGTIIATIHPKIDTSGWSVDNLDEHIKEVRDLYLDWASDSEKQLINQ